GMSAWTSAGYPASSFEAITIDDLRGRWQRHEPLTVLDVRDAAEWNAGHIEGSQHIHVADLLSHLHEIPRDKPVATICQSGHRAAIAASIVSSLGIETLAVQRGGVPRWLKVDATVQTADHAHL
ncbi:MAG TPA: rhodanese-like domain-containing protein, partial [Ktedonobacterales bacterium]|nr:rhodanese-like domain-containing protein [Ktedonobacterales bacterium]